MYGVNGPFMSVSIHAGLQSSCLPVLLCNCGRNLQMEYRMGSIWKTDSSTVKTLVLPK